MVEEAGLKAGSDVTMINMGFADLSDALRAGKIDGAAVPARSQEGFHLCCGQP